MRTLLFTVVLLFSHSACFAEDSKLDWPGVRQLLERKIDLNFDRTPLPLVAERLRKRLGVSVEINTAAFKEDFISLDETITARVKNVSVRTALAMIAEPLGTVVCLSHGRLVWTTEDEAERPRRYFDVTYTVHPLLQAGISMDDLCRLVRQAVGGWPNWQGAGKLKRGNGTITVTQSWHSQIEIADFLTELEPLLQGKPSRLNFTRLTRAEAALEREVSFEWNAMPLRDVAAWLEKETGVPVWVRSKFIKEEKISLDHQLHCKLSKVALESFLDAALGQVGLTVIPRGDVLELTTEVCSHEFHNRAYSLRPASGLVGVDVKNLLTFIQQEFHGEWMEGPPQNGGEIIAAGGVLLARNNWDAQREARVLLERIRGHNARVPKTIKPSASLRRRTKLKAALRKPITIDFPADTVPGAVERLAKQSGVPIAWNSKMLYAEAGEDVRKRYRDVRIEFKATASPRELLSRVLKPFNLRWYVDRDVVMIGREPPLHHRTYTEHEVSGILGRQVSGVRVTRKNLRELLEDNENQGFGSHNPTSLLVGKRLLQIATKQTCGTIQAKLKRLTVEAK